MNLLLDYASLFILLSVIVILIYGLVVIHDIPYEIAVKRGHPQKDAIHVAGWVSLFFVHVLWPFLWVWAMLYDPEHKRWAGVGDARSSNSDASESALNDIHRRLEDIESKLLEKEEIK